MKNLLLTVISWVLPLLLFADPCPNDTIPPIIESRGSVWDCTFDIFQDSDTNFITVTEESECGLRTVQIARWSITKGSCTDDFVKRYLVTWYAEDMAGNISNLDQEITIIRPDLAEVQFPADTVIQCPDTGLDVLSLLDVPTVYGHPLTDMCGFRVKARIIDTISGWLVGQCLPQITREWRIIDNCTGMMRIDTQTISMIDTIRPIIACSSLEDTVIVSLNPETCTGSYTFPAVGAIDFCAEGEELSFQHYIDGILTDSVVNLFAGWYDASIVVNDPCNNADTCNYVIRVLDDSSPQVLCSLDTVILQSLAEEIDISELNITIESCDPVEVVYRFEDQDPGMEASFQTFNCDMVNSTVNVIVTATNSNGVSSEPTTCHIFVEAEDGVCNLIRANPEKEVASREKTDYNTRIYYNGQELILRSQIGMSEVYLYNTSGQILWKKAWESARLEYQSHLPQEVRAGIYIVAVLFEDGKTDNAKVVIF